MKTSEPADYKKIKNRHIALAKDLLNEKSLRWNDLFKEFGGISSKGRYLIQHYEKRLRDECCGSSVEDFCQHLQMYLQRKNNYVLITLIEINQHFFSEYFKDVLRDVYQDFFDCYGDARLKENKKRKVILWM